MNPLNLQQLSMLSFMRMRPKGALGKSKLDGKEAEITLLLQKKVSKASLARIVEVSPMTLEHFIRTRKLQPSTPQRG